MFYFSYFKYRIYNALINTRRHNYTKIKSTQVNLNNNFGKKLVPMHMCYRDMLLYTFVCRVRTNTKIHAGLLKTTLVRLVLNSKFSNQNSINVIFSVLFWIHNLEIIQNCVREIYPGDVKPQTLCRVLICLNWFTFTLPAKKCSQLHKARWLDNKLIKY